MKRFLICAVILAALPALVFAVNFSPTPMKLTAPGSLHYEFDGKELELPVTLSGVQATAVFMVYTKDKAQNIVNIRNGFLGWHYVNKVDTCVYVSGVLSLQKGTNTIRWSGKDVDSKMVPAGDYTYYIWAYDGVSSRSLACSKFGPRANSIGHFQQYDQNNKVLANPIWCPPGEAMPSIAGGYDGKTQTPGLKVRVKWVIGSDPMDSTMIETTTYKGWGDSGKIAFMPGDHRYFFVHNYIPKAVVTTGLDYVMKLKWVPNGLSEQVLTWGENGVFTFANTSANYPGPISDNVSSLWVIVGDNSYPLRENPEIMYYLDPNDGTKLRTYDFSWLWWDETEFKRGFKYHGGPTIANFSQGRIYCSGWSHCLKHCIDPYQENDADVTLWYNGEGDHVGDRFDEPTRTTDAWLCSGGSGGPWVYDFNADANGFSMLSAYDLGAVSFGLIAPDGRGITTYFALPGDTAKIKYGQVILDCDSAFDGIYCDNPPDASYPTALWYVAHDSIKGDISNAIGVADNTPAAFSVAQNVPNPFNPSTTISFTLAKPGKVTVEVFNSAGQRVETLTNASMSAGVHSIAWNASKHAAGMYFYTVKSGDFSRTMKMTLLK